MVLERDVTADDAEAAARDGDAATGLTVRGVAVIEIGRKFDDLETFSWETQLFRDYLKRPRDMFDMTVVALDFFETPLKVANVWTSGRDGDDTLKWASKSGRGGTSLCSAPVIVWSDIVNNLLRSGQTVGDFAQAHGQHGLEAIRIPSIKIPDFIATLVHNGSWTHLIGMRRWQAFEPLLPASWKLSRHERLPESLHESPHDRDDLDISQARFKQAAQRIREWAPMILESPNGEDHRIPIYQEIQFLEGCAEVFSPDPEPPPDHGFMFAAAVMLEVIRMSLHVRGHNFLFVAQRAMNIAFKPALALGLQAILRAGKRLIPSKPSLHRARLSLDVALMVAHRRWVATAPRVFRFGWADSSPQHQRDWLLCSHDWIYEHDLEAAAAAVDALVAERREEERKQAEAGGSDDREEEDDDDVYEGDEHQQHRDRWQKLNQVLWDSLHRHDHPPAALGQCATSIAHKVAALCHMWGLEVPSDFFTGFLHSFRAFATDMGTELGISEFQLESAQALMPYWMRPVALVSDVDVDDQRLPSDTVTPAASSALLPNSLTIPGMLHICWNMCAEVNYALAHWKTFWEQLKVMEKLVSFRYRRELLLATCFLGTQWADERSSFERFSHRLYEPRWGEVLEFCRSFFLLFEVLRLVWDENKFRRGMRASGEEKEREDEGKFNPKDATKIMNDKLFGAYLELVIALGEIPEQIAKWAEGCACHEHLFIGTQTSKRTRRLQKVFQHDLGDCPMKGKRLQELIAGEAKNIFNRVCRSLLKRLTKALRVRLSASQWLTLSVDFESGKTLMWAGLEVKLSYASKLPVILAGLVHSDEAVARRLATDAVQQFSAQDPRNEHLNHALTLKFLQPSTSLRKDIDEFVNGKPRSELPELFKECTPWKFTNIVERYIEAGHAAVKLRGRVTHGGSSIALARRLPRLERDISKRPAWLTEVMDAFRLTRSVVDIPSLLGIGLHPKLPTGLGAKWLGRRRDLFCKELNVVLYRADVEGVHQDVSQPKKHHELKRARQVMQELQFVKRRQPPIRLESVMLEAIFDHVKAVAGGGGRFQSLSLPSEVAAETMRQLDNVLQPGGSQPRSSNITLESDVQLVSGGGHDEAAQPRVPFCQNNKKCDATKKTDTATRKRRPPRRENDGHRDAKKTATT